MTDQDQMFENHYTCPNCGYDWSDVWSATCNDRCPVCRTETEPHESKESV